jgi:hypothetical protein
MNGDLQTKSLPAFIVEQSERNPFGALPPIDGAGLSSEAILEPAVTVNSIRLELVRRFTRRIRTPPFPMGAGFQGHVTLHRAFR